jgi:hypothetical protein
MRINRPVHVEVLSQWPSTIQMFVDEEGIAFGLVVDSGKGVDQPGSMQALAVSWAS